MSSNKEAVLSEKQASAHFGQSVLVGFSDVIQTKDFATFEDMLKALQQAWDTQWLRVYSARPEGQHLCTPAVQLICLVSLTTARLSWLVSLCLGVPVHMPRRSSVEKRQPVTPPGGGRGGGGACLIMPSASPQS